VCNVTFATDHGQGGWSSFKSGSGDDKRQRKKNDVSLPIRCSRVVVIGGRDCIIGIPIARYR
jgi:hypothetical protein